MNVIIDSNILFSALIKNSVTRKLILESDQKFLFPSYIFIEMKKHQKLLLKKSKLVEKDFNELLRLLLTKVVIVPNEVLAKHKEMANQIVADIDPNDVLFFACALAFPNSIIWSDDKKLKNQTKIIIINTKEMINFIQPP
tara:strand:- start:52630 stop:53049 length:420 start_codon:yes stop_codon:yes gene_type:complete